jgi:hypothetical protein
MQVRRSRHQAKKTDTNAEARIKTALLGGQRLQNVGPCCFAELGVFLAGSDVLAHGCRRDALVKAFQQVRGTISFALTTGELFLLTRLSVAYMSQFSCDAGRMDGCQYGSERRLGPGHVHRAGGRSAGCQSDSAPYRRLGHGVATHQFHPPAVLALSPLRTLLEIAIAFALPVTGCPCVLAAIQVPITRRPFIVTT